MMKTYWVLSKKQEEENDDEGHSLQQKQKGKAIHMSSRRASPATISFSDDRHMKQDSHKQRRSYSIPSPSLLPAIHVPRRSIPGPDEWPELENSIQLANRPPSIPLASSSTAVSTASTISTTEESELGELRPIPEVQSQIVLPEELQALVTERGNDLSLDEFAKLAEENAQKARKLADWVAELASVARKRENERSTSETAEGRKETENCTIVL